MPIFCKWGMEESIKEAMTMAVKITRAKSRKNHSKSTQEKAEEIRKVTAGEIQNLAKDIFKNEKLNLALIGPFKEKASFLKILEF